MNFDENDGGIFVQEKPSNDHHQHNIYNSWLQNKIYNFHWRLAFPSTKSRSTICRFM